jgi:hypothetical protein
MIVPPVIVQAYDAAGSRFDPRIAAQRIAA